MDRHRALTLAEGARGELLALLEALIAAPSPYGSSAQEAQGRLGQYLELNGFAVEVTDDSAEAQRAHPEFSPPPPAAEAPVNLVATPPEPAGLTLFAHVDTEAVTDGWSSPPCEATWRNGRVHGLGAADDKGGLAAAAVAAALLQRHGGRAPLLASVHGKGGGARGTLPVLARILSRMPAPARMPEAGDCLYVHPPENGAGLAILKNASRGVLDVALRVTGWSGPPREIGTRESAPFEEGGNALEACLRLVETLRQGELADCELNLGRVVAGEAAGLTPVRCDAGLRVLFRGERTTADVLAAIHRAAEDHARPAAGAGEAFRFEITAPGIRANPAETLWKSGFAVQLQTAVAEITGQEPVAYAEHLASDIRFPIRIGGVSSVGVGSLAGNFYGPDEWVDLDDLVRLVAVLVFFGARWTESGPQSRRVATRKRRRNG